jgi:hypothetical protein
MQLGRMTLTRGNLRGHCMKTIGIFWREATSLKEGAGAEGRILEVVSDKEPRGTHPSRGERGLEEGDGAEGGRPTIATATTLGGVSSC